MSKTIDGIELLRKIKDGEIPLRNKNTDVILF